MSVRLTRRFVAAAAALLLGSMIAPLHADEEIKPFGKWRIQFNHKADNDGSVTFRIAPVGQAAIDVETRIPADTHENHAADILRDSLKASLGEGYHVETDDGEDVLIKRRGKTPKFVVTMVSSSLTGLEIRVKRD